MIEEEKQSPPPNFIPALLRYKWYGLFAGTLLFLISSAVVLSLPSVYRSTGVVAVESQQIPNDMIRSTVTTLAAERIGYIQQRVMTRERLLEIVKKYSFFNLDEKSPVEVSKKINYIRQNISVEVVSGVKESRQAPANAIAFNVSFDSLNPFVAQAVANDLVTLFLSENLKIRSERATETTEFLVGEANKVKESLESTERKILLLKQENRNSLPENLSVYSARQESVMASLKDVQAQKDRVSLKLRVLESPDSAFGASAALDLPKEQSPKITELKQRLSQALLTYTPEHPDIIDLNRQIEMLESAGGVTTSTGVGANNPTQLLAQQRLSLNSELAQLKTQEKDLKATIADLEDRISNIPKVQQALNSLERERNSKASQYDVLLTKARTAEVAQNLEDERKAERFFILEPPIQPIIPVSPDRRKFMLLGAGVSYGLPISIILLLGFLNKNVIGRSSLSLVTDVPIISVFPHVYTTLEIVNKRRYRRRIFLLMIMLVGLSFVLLHLFYMPFDELSGKMLQKINL